MRKNRIAISIISILLLLSCTKDDNGIYPKELKFAEYQDLDFKMWIGGVEVNTDGIDPEQVFSRDCFEMFEDYQKMVKEQTYIFKNEYQLEVRYRDSYYGHEYEFRNDSIFGIGIIPDEEYFMCEGNLDVMKFYWGYYRAQHSDEYGYGERSGCGGMYITLEYLLDEIDYTGLEDMGDNDTIAIYNSMMVFE